MLNGTWPSKPYAFAWSASLFGPSWRPISPKIVLHEYVSASESDTFDPPGHTSPPKLESVCVVCGSVRLDPGCVQIAAFGSTPSSNAAEAVTSLNVDPG